MSSLASQLQKIASLDAARLTSRTGAPSSKSYLFPARTAASHDLDSIFALAQSGFYELVALDVGFEEFEDELFSEKARRTDRMMLNQADNERLDRVLERCLRRLGKWIDIMAGGKCIEWLVRRFRVHELNANTVIQVFLPYHDSPNFARMLAILTLAPSSAYHAPFAALVQKAQPVPRAYLATHLSATRDPSLRLLTDAASMIRRALDEDVVHRALLTFWTGLLVDMIEVAGKGVALGEATVKVFVEAFVDVLSTPNTGADVNAAVYPPLVLMTRSTTLADAPFAAILSALITPGTGAEPAQRVLTLLVLLSQRRASSSGLGEHAAKHLLKIPNLANLLISALEKYALEDGVKIVVGAMAEHPGTCEKHVAIIVDYPTLPPAVVDTLATRLATSSVAAARPLLQTLRQRHPSIVDPILLSSSVDLLPATGSGFVDVHSSDVTARVAGVKDMYNVLSAAGVTAANVSEKLVDEQVVSARTAVLARLADDDAAVVGAVYAEPELLRALLVDVEYTQVVARAFAVDQPKADVVRAHLKYAAGSGADNATLFERVLIPVLLAVEGRAVVGLDELALFKGDLAVLAGFKTVPSAEKSALIEYNRSVLSIVSTAILQSTEQAKFIDALVANLDSPVPAAKLFATLVLAEVLPSISSTALTIALSKLSSTLAGSLRDIADIEVPTSDSLLRSVVSKPANPKTQQRAAVALLLAVAKSPRPSTAWLLSTDAVALALYRWANSARLSPAAGRAVLQATLAQVGSDALVFLASVWTGDADAAIRSAALEHAAAFVAAARGTKTDFQVMVPAVLVGLQDADKGVRQAAVALLRAIAADAGDEIYAIDSVYGARSELVQLLKPSDLTSYLQTLLAVADDLLIDPSRLGAVHAAALDGQSKAGKKDAAHRRAVLDWLFSHALAWRFLSARTSLLTSIAKVSNPARLRGSTALLLPLVKDADEAAWLEAAPADKRAAYLDLVLGSFAARHASAVDPKSETWDFLVDLLQKPEANVLAQQLRTLAAQKLADGLFASLQPAQKTQYVVVYIHALHALLTDESLVLKALLPKLVLSPGEIVDVLQAVVQPLEAPNQRKKAKHDETDDATEQAVSGLTVFIESRSWATLPANAPLVATLMGILSSVLSRRQSIKEGVDYLEQEVLGAILSGVEKISDEKALRAAHVGIEVVIKVIRASGNPRTAQRALLVAAELARLIPDAVLHNIMPIFTFMGAADFQRDDAYSFGVVEKTVARIVPVMAAALRDKAPTGDRLALYNEARTFVGIFTDMAGRLPRHRTLPFFVHLVKSLGANDFLAPTLMLLVDRATTKAGRNGPADLPLGLAGAFSAEVRVEAVSEIVNEVRRLVADLSAVDDHQAFLSHVAQVDPTRTLRQATVLLGFTSSLARQLAGKPASQPRVEAAIEQLIALAAAVSTPALRGSELGRAVQDAVGAVMGLLSVDGLLAVVVRVLEAGTAHDVDHALTVFTERLGLVRADVRARNAPQTSAVVRLAAGMLGKQSTPACLAAIGAVAASAVPQEDGALAAAVPAVVGLLRAPATSNAHLAAALALLDTLVRRLASRAIPHIQAIVDAALALVASSPAVARQAFAALATLVDALPTFISGKQVGSILAAAVRYRATDDQVSAAVTGGIAKRVATKTLVPVVMDLWKSMQDEDQVSLEGFFLLLRQTLKHADRTALAALLKPVFAFFLDVFDLRHRLSLRAVPVPEPTVVAVERSAIGSFLELVNKLSEGTFKPLFVRLYDWAVVDLADTAAAAAGLADRRLVDRTAVLLHVMAGLLERFRHLLSPYMAVLQPHVDELLGAYAARDIADHALWALLLDTLATSFEVDDGAYYTDAIHLGLVPQLGAQLGLFPASAASSSSAAAAAAAPIARAFAALAQSTASEPVLRALNGALCMATRADDAPTRLAALGAMDAVWASQADELIAFVPETVAEFLAELLEDENAEVEAAARKVLGRIEGVVGSLKEYLE
ncbi:snoRNA-binding rRNA-processing protein utp10 [Cryptotrichosporon argae]